MAAGLARTEKLAGDSVEVLVNNTGMQHRSPLLNFPEEAWRRIPNTNLTGPFLIAREFAWKVGERSRSKIVSALSLQSELARYGIAHHATNKDRIKILIKCVYASWSSLGVQVNRSDLATSRRN